MSSVTWTTYLQEDDEDRSDECALVESAKNDPAALTKLYRKHYPAIAAYVHRRVGDQHEADDIVSNVFLAMVKNLGSYRWRGVPFRVWLFRLANTQLSRWARQRRRWAWDQLGDRDPQADQDSESNAEVVELVLSTLPTRLQAVLNLHYLEGMKVSEIALIVDSPEGTVKSRLSEGRALMRERLSKRGYR